MSLHELAQQVHAALPEDLRADVTVEAEIDRGTLCASTILNGERHALAIAPGGSGIGPRGERFAQSIRLAVRKAGIAMYEEYEELIPGARISLDDRRADFTQEAWIAWTDSLRALPGPVVELHLTEAGEAKAKADPTWRGSYLGLDIHVQS